MTETFYRTGTYHVTHSEFGGRIYASDFNKRTTLAEAAARIMSDRQFDLQCQKKAVLPQSHKDSGLPQLHNDASVTSRKKFSAPLQEYTTSPSMAGERN